MGIWTEKRKVTAIVNAILVCVIIFVFAVIYIPPNAIPSYENGKLKAIYNGNRNKKQVSLMFNIYENTEVVNGILDVLKEYNVKSTFFVGGCWADDNQVTLNRIVNEGHELGNHGYFHKDHKNLSFEQNKQEIYNNGVVVKSLCNYDMKLFAPPSGSYSNDTLVVADQLGYKVIMWSKDTIDWRDSDQNKVFSRATKDIANGDLVLMHPKEHTLKTLPKILEFYRQLGYNSVTVSENIRED